jgi:hypothetical protein
LALVFQGLFFCAFEENQEKMEGNRSHEAMEWVKKVIFFELKKL